MSEFAAQPDVCLTQIARDIDSDFQFVADRLPDDIKIAAAGSTVILCALEGIGRLSATYLGKTHFGNDPLNNFVVRVSMRAEGHDDQLGFYKDFALTWMSRRSIGPVIDKEPTPPEELANCPVPISTLALSINSLRNEFARIRGMDLPQNDQIVELDSFREF